MTRLSTLILEALTRTRKTKSSLSRELGVSPQYVSLISRGVRLPRNPVLLRALGKALGIPLGKLNEALLGDTMDKEAQRRVTLTEDPADAVPPPPKVRLSPIPRPPKPKRIRVKEARA